MEFIVETKVFGKSDILGFAVWPFIFIKKGLKESNPYQYKVMLNHERIHHKQQLELLVIFFYFFYLLSLIPGGYWKSVFEMEAYNNQYDFKYLRRRKCFQYLRNKKK